MSACSEILEPFPRGPLCVRLRPLSLEQDPQCGHRLSGALGPDSDVAEAAGGDEAEMGHRIIVRSWLPVRHARTRNTYLSPSLLFPSLKPINGGIRYVI